MLPSQFPECTRQVSPPALRPGQVEPFCLQQEQYFSRCGVSRERKGKNVFRHPPRSRPLCLKTNSTTNVSGSLLGARRCDFKARQTSARDILSKSGKKSSRLLAISAFATRLVRRILLYLVAKLEISVANFSFMRVLGEQNDVLEPLGRQSDRGKKPRSRLESNTT